MRWQLSSNLSTTVVQCVDGYQPMCRQLSTTVINRVNCRCQLTVVHCVSNRTTVGQCVANCRPMCRGLLPNASKTVVQNVYDCHPMHWWLCCLPMCRRLSFVLSVVNLLSSVISAIKQLSFNVLTSVVQCVHHCCPMCRRLLSVVLTVVKTTKIGWGHWVGTTKKGGDDKNRVGTSTHHPHTKTHRSTHTQTH